MLTPWSANSSGPRLVIFRRSRLSESFPSSQRHWTSEAHRICWRLIFTMFSLRFNDYHGRYRTGLYSRIRAQPLASWNEHNHKDCEMFFVSQELCWTQVPPSPSQGCPAMSMFECRVPFSSPMLIWCDTPRQRILLSRLQGGPNNLMSKKLEHDVMGRKTPC